MRILVLGASGLLGGAVHRATAPGVQVVGLTRAGCDVTSAHQVARAIERHGADVVVNAAALADNATCNADPARAMAVNVGAARTVARAAQRQGTTLVHVSGNIVFTATEAPVGRREFEPADNHHGGILAQAKAEAEQAVLDDCTRVLLIRTACLFGTRPGGAWGGLPGRVRRAVTAGETLRMVNNSFTSAAYAPDVADALLTLLRHGQRGIFHLVNEGSTTPYTLTHRLRELTGAHPAQIEETFAEHTEYRLLADDKTTAAGAPMRGLEDALRAWLREDQHARP
ncbi:SDR family oxidoreductase [Streptomyces rubellomurinus]|uniref:dTDP-4-dehydrorhamnose reductase n=1 Tax=Streptomyces rubellomurinus (strain ATCC 31215) TaxID=359131 RepID=A0A0F2T6J7_STRR3|nr:sugar nucleotide-binding protein [Streptomyces rubellomurinus]KJS58021.1 hypothetical protein VM95_35995 [Streptomyces rubellomurinus]